MNVFDRLERRWGWLSFPGFLRYFALFQVMVFVLQIFRPDLSGLLAFDRDKIFAGEIWRVATMFFAEAQFGKPTIFNILLLIFAVNFIFMVNDGLEEAWGSFKTSLFCYTGILLALAASFLYPVAVPFGGEVGFFRLGLVSGRLCASVGQWLGRRQRAGGRPLRGDALYLRHRAPDGGNDR